MLKVIIKSEANFLHNMCVILVENGFDVSLFIVA